MHIKFLYPLLCVTPFAINSCASKPSMKSDAGDSIKISADTLPVTKNVPDAPRAKPIDTPMPLAEVTVTLTRSNIVPGVTETFVMNDERDFLKLRRTHPSEDDKIISRGVSSREKKLTMMQAITESGVLDSTFASVSSHGISTLSIRIGQRINEISWPGITPGMEISREVRKLYLLYIGVLKGSGVKIK